MARAFVERFNGVAAFDFFGVPLQLVLDYSILVLVNCMVDLRGDALTVLVCVIHEISQRSMFLVVHLGTHCF